MAPKPSRLDAASSKYTDGTSTSWVGLSRCLTSEKAGVNMPLGARIRIDITTPPSRIIKARSTRASEAPTSLPSPAALFHSRLSMLRTCFPPISTSRLMLRKSMAFEATTPPAAVPLGPTIALSVRASSGDASARCFWVNGKWPVWFVSTLVTFSSQTIFMTPEFDLYVKDSGLMTTPAWHGFRLRPLLSGLLLSWSWPDPAVTVSAPSLAAGAGHVEEARSVYFLFPRKELGPWS